jgi:hypothetical protein
MSNIGSAGNDVDVEKNAHKLHKRALGLHLSFDEWRSPLKNSARDNQTNLTPKTVQERTYFPAGKNRHISHRCGREIGACEAQLSR